MAKSGKTKSPKEVKPIPTAAKENGKTASKDSFAKAALPEKSKTKDKGKGKAKAVEPEPAPVAPFDDDDDWEDEEELDEAEVMGTAASSDQEPISDSEEEEDDEEENEDSDEDDDGVDEEGMERLLKALGEDGLDDFDKAQIMALNGAGSDVEVGSGEEGNEDEDEESEGGSHDKEYESGNEEEEEEADHARTAAKSKIAPQAADDEEYEEEDDEAIPLDEAEHSVDEDAVPRRKVEIDNKVALERIRETIALDSSLPWTETLTVTYPHTIEVDVTDDLNREVAFYKQALYCANEARQLAAKHKLPFTRPSDYFAEMVKSDSHMERIRQRLLNESAAIKLSEDKKKQREGKKFGKQVQMEKLKERERSKKELDEKIKGLKRKRKDMLSGDGEHNVNDDEFDVAVENAISDNNSRPNKKAKMSRQSRDKKFGFGKGAGRFSKQNTRESTDSFGGAGKGKGKKPGHGGGKKSQRPGKSKRMNARNK